MSIKFYSSCQFGRFVVVDVTYLQSKLKQRNEKKCGSKKRVRIKVRVVCTKYKTEWYPCAMHSSG